MSNSGIEIRLRAVACDPIGEEEIGRNEGQYLGWWRSALLYGFLILAGLWAVAAGMVSKVQSLMSKVWWYLSVPSVCKWCERTQRYAPLWFFGSAATHGICKECKNNLLAGLWKHPYETKRKIEGEHNRFHSAK